MSTDFDELKTLLEKSDEEVKSAFTKFEGQVKENGEATKGVKDELKAQTERNDEIAAEMKRLEGEITELFQKGTKGETKQAPKSIGAQFVESEQFKNYQSGSSNKASMEFKNTIIGEGGSPQEPNNDIVPLQTMAGIVGGAFRQLRLLDLINTGQASGNTIHYTRELTFSNAAAETAEGTTKPEATLTFEGIDTPVRTIAHFLKVSKQVLDDAPALQSYIDRRLRYGVELRMEKQIINGDGTSPNLSGMLASGNFTSLTAASGDNNFDFANKAKYKVVESDYQADYYLINPADWGAMERLKDNDGRYSGDGAVGYLQNGLIPTLWGLPVIPSNSVPAGKLLSVANDASMFWQRQASTVEIFDQNEDDVKNNLLTIRGEARGAFTVFRPSAIVAGDLPNPAA
jgi:HK97 family phage major capsid protein